MLVTEGRRTHGEGRPPLRALAAIVLAGVLLRLALVAGAGRSELQSDEANYVYLGLAQQHFGVLLDSYRYLWPPFHPWLLGEALARFGLAGATVVQVLQALASGAVGFAIGGLAWRLGSARASLVAAALWAVHLPLAGYTHLLWSEPFFLALFTPALERLVAALQAPEGEPGAALRDRRFLAAGLLFGASLWVKSFALYLLPVLAVCAAVAVARRSGAVAALRGASLLVLAPAVVTLPWTLRNLEVYGRAVPSAATLGENAFIGLNARYMNFDYVALRRPRAERGAPPIEDLALAPLVAPPLEDGRPSPGWRRADAQPHTVDRQGEQLSRAFAYARAHPGWAVRTRLKRLADLVTPLSFTVRHAALGLYGEAPLGRAPLRQGLVLLALANSVIVLGAAAVGLARGLRASAGIIVFLPVLCYVAASALLLSMSRVRVPAEPLLIVLAALALVHALEPTAARQRERLRWALAAVLLVGLFGAWAMNLREVVAVALDAWRGGAA